MKNILPILICSAVVTSCGIMPKKKNKNNDNKNDGSSDLVTYQIKLEADSKASLSEDEKSILTKINNGEAVSFSLITKLLIRDHASYYNQLAKEKNKDELKLDDLVALVSKLVAAQNGEADPHQIKLKYESKMKEINGSNSKYNGVATTLGHISKENQQQCYSGTMLNQVVWRGNPTFRNQNPVVIFEDGHILSGYMKKEEGKWHMYGVETTALGRAQIKYGATDSISKPVRVVDAELFAIMELFKNQLSNSNDLAQEILKITAEKYDLKLGPISGFQGNGTSLAGLNPNSSPFAFGDAKEEDKAIDRVEIDSVDASTPRGEQAGSAIKAALSGQILVNIQSGFCTGRGSWVETAEGCLDPKTNLVFGKPFPITLADLGISSIGESTRVSYAIANFVNEKCGDKSIYYATYLNMIAEIPLVQSISGNYGFGSEGESLIVMTNSAMGSRGGDGIGENLAGLENKSLQLLEGHYLSFPRPTGVNLAFYANQMPSNMVGTCVTSLSTHNDVPYALH